LSDDVFSEALAKEEASRVSNDGAKSESAVNAKRRTMIGEHAGGVRGLGVPGFHRVLDSAFVKVI
jgi:hypothetical protein